MTSLMTMIISLITMMITLMIKSGQAWNVAQHIRPGLAIYQDCPQILRNISGKTRPDGWRCGEKAAFWRDFWQILLSFFCFFLDNLYMKSFFAKKNQSDWPPLGVGGPIAKVRHVYYRVLPIPAMSTDKYKIHSRAICSCIRC